ncbi:MAG TPA: hypothetical protein VHQ65_01155 [Thermoanaerobaculia bacterium]|nr:hypothetical protein [Thermoanaerobaculia bacterium]
MKRTTSLALLLALACLAPAVLAAPSAVAPDAAPAVSAPRGVQTGAAPPGVAAPAAATPPALRSSAPPSATAPGDTEPVLFVGTETFGAGTLAEFAEARLFLSSGTCYDDYYQCQAECQCGYPFDPFECRKICAAGCCSCVCP